jgi:putative Mn2+ efflux pump MntP
MDALIIGLAYGIKQVALSWLVIWVILFTSLFGLTGMAFKNKLKPKTGKIIDLVSGLLLIILGILVW